DLGHGHPERAPADPRVREAMSKAINRQLITDTIFGGNARPWGVNSSPVTPGYLDLPPDPYDPAEAQTLLDAAGWGEGFETEIWAPDGYLGTEEKQAIQADWRQIGIDATLVNVEFVTWIEDLTNRTRGGVTWMSIGSDYFDPSGYTHFEFTDAVYGTNSDPWFDEQANLLLSAPTDEERIAAWSRILERHHEERIAMTLWAVDSFLLAGSNVADWKRVQGIFVPHNMEWVKLNEHV
ncbi:MAG: ABC transporter substrate-binding protein, partial [Planctomycetota bacterium]|nr:ABC transporter substrate-binding protein [Planctomycetota bacterium]